jgi:hypothetical protein
MESLYNVSNTSVFLCKGITLQSSPPSPPRILNQTRTVSFPAIKLGRKQFTCPTALTALMQIILFSHKLTTLDSFIKFPNLNYCKYSASPKFSTSKF